MLKSKNFIEKLLTKLERIDKESLQQYVTALVEENELLENTLEYLNQGVVISDSQGEVLAGNRRAQHWLGLSPVSDSKSISLFGIKDRRVNQFLKKAIGSDQDKNSENFNLLIPSEASVRIAVTPIGNTKKIYLVLLENLTEKLPEKNDINAKAAQIETLVRLAAGVAHEIGNPLNSLGIHLQLLKKEIRELPSAKRKEMDAHLEVMNSETQRLDRIVRNFLKATRKPPLRFRQENLEKILQEVLGLLKPELQERKAKVEVRYDESIPNFLMDRDRIHQIFVNLLKNAMESMPKGGRIKIDVEKNGKIIQIAVRDEGVGIPEGDLPYVFEAYFTTKSEGSGLGLMTVLNAVVEHQGRIEVDSKVGKGTTFMIYLPLRQPKLQLPMYKAEKKSKS